MTLCIKPTFFLQHIYRILVSNLQGLVCVSHRQDFVSGVDAAQFAERTEQPLTGPAVELQLLLIVLRTRQNLTTTKNSNKIKSALIYPKQDRKSIIMGM